MNRKSKEKIRNKIRSESGASLAAALLFFIVCAVVGSIIIAAAMSSAGRMSGITSADNQRYALESARSLIEDAMLSDPEDSETNPMKRSYYENVSDVGSDSPTKIPNLETAQITSLNQMKLQMAESLYTQYWREVKATWNENSTQSSVSGDNSGDKGVGEKVVGWTPSEKAVGWTPSGEVAPQTKKVTFYKLTTESGNEAAGFVPVTATFTMRPDFSILVELQAAASAQSGEGTSSAGTANAYVMTDSFLLYPQITVDYESVLPENPAAGKSDDIESGAAGNQRRITCKIEWLTEG
ncbi:MAG: hypothetical protein SOS94_07320 [Lachnospiraceae bacterium]|nr:hypothetical protein [Bacillota bacterium]MDY2949702.1 hypothetical protein [Lachnospiraceae bacterium]